MSLFPRMTTVVPEATCGIARVEHRTVTRHESMMSGLRPGEFCDEGTYAVLKVHGQTMMSDTRLEHISNWDVVHAARGDVLIAGLGLGMILHPIIAKKEVNTVTVVEKYGDVIRIVEPTLKSDPKAMIYESDIFTWTPPVDVSTRKPWKFDTIYFDIWAVICGDLYEEMKALTRKAASWRRPGAWVGCWKKDEMRELARGDR